MDLGSLVSIVVLGLGLASFGLVGETEAGEDSERRAEEEAPQAGAARPDRPRRRAPAANRKTASSRADDEG